MKPAPVPAATGPHRHHAQLLLGQAEPAGQRAGVGRAFQQSGHQFGLHLTLQVGAGL